MATDDIFKKLASAESTQVDTEAPPSEAVSDWLHGRASTTRPEDIHHRLGTGPTEASPGGHQHNGKDSKLILAGANVTVTDITATATGTQIAAAVNALNAIMRTYLGSA